MPCSRHGTFPLSVRIMAGALLWLAVVSGLHYWLNVDAGGRRVIRMGYMPVITNLAAPLLDEATKDGEGIRFEALKFASFAEMGEALRNGQIQAAFMIAPLSIVLRQQGEDVKIIYIGNRHESTLAARKELGVRRLSDLAGRTMAVPMRYSGHNLSILEEIEKAGLSGQIRIVEMNPPDMASALAAGGLDAYYVGEPFAAQTIQNGLADVVWYVESVWDGFICNLLVVNRRFIQESPEVVQRMVRGAARSGLWAREHPREAAEIAARYWNQDPDLVFYAMTTPKDRIVYDRFVPKSEEIQAIADRMQRFGLISHSGIDGLVADHFAAAVEMEAVSEFDLILDGP